MNNLPKLWVVEATRDNRWSQVIDYINLRIGEDKFVGNNYGKYYGYDGGMQIETNYGYNTGDYEDLYGFPHILTIDEFLTCITTEKSEEIQAKYQIYLEGKDVPEIIHNSLLEAEEEAERLVSTYNRKAYVIKIVSTFENKVIQTKY